MNWFALAIGSLMGAVIVLAIVVPIFTLTGFISVDTADVLLTASLVEVTAAYTFATYGKWWSD
ncbi:hypothetical protein [Halorubrum sp. Ib24]|uniref:hypothetical protein n=1 Tax=Halorubrum sp. Ib24 TaxID=1383850 RepID=UPI001179E87A|nr:hypothetical protein [Halorubrum sp. Ib24]